MNNRSLFFLVSSTVTTLCLSGCNACTEQHDPTRSEKLYEREREVANQPKSLLNEDGSYPSAKAEESTEMAAKEGQDVASTNPVMSKYQQFCASCHGAKGAGKGPAAASLNPKPRNMTDVAWQESVDDAHIRKVINQGGSAVGLSPTMAPWGGVLNDQELDQMVELVRSFKGK
jgi:mono/diheme cytochrome c family protein